MARTGLPKSYIKRWGISKKAWSEYRKVHGKKRNARRRNARRRNVKGSGGKAGYVGHTTTTTKAGKTRTGFTRKVYKKGQKYAGRGTVTKARKCVSKGKGGGRGWKCGKRQNPKRRNSKVRRRRRMPRRNRYGRFVKTKRNPSRRKNTRRRNTRRRNVRRRNSTARKSNPRRRNTRRRNVRRRNPRRRNPTIKGAFGSVKRQLMNPKAWIKMGVGFAGFFASDKIGAQIANFIKGKVSQLSTGYAGMAVDAVSRFGVAALIASIAPRGYGQAILMGGGIAAVKPIGEQIVAKLGFGGLSGYQYGPGMIGMGDWMTTGDLRRMGLRGVPAGNNGMGGWLTTADARRLGVGV